jgi:DNA-binding NtrC family response regulator
MNRILVIDDDEVIRSIVGKALELAGYQVQLAVDGQEGMRKFRSGSFDVVIVDMWMPQKDGLETLMDIRRNTPHARVIAMSGGGRVGTNPLNWARQLGAAAVLTKPFGIEQLLKAVRSALGAPVE